LANEVRNFRKKKDDEEVVHAPRQLLISKNKKSGEYVTYR
jgi:hypothetical protein